MASFDTYRKLVHRRTTYYCRDDFINEFPQFESRDPSKFYSEHNYEGYEPLYGMIDGNKITIAPDRKRCSKTCRAFHVKEYYDIILAYSKITAKICQIDVKPVEKLDKIDPNEFIIEPAPPILNLPKCPDSLLVVGKNIRNCYFNLKTIRITYSIHHNIDMITHPASSYVYTKHYIRYMIAGKKHIFLTLYGVIKFLSLHWIGDLIKFMKWFTVDVLVGTRNTEIRLDAPNEIGIEIIGINYEIVKNLFSMKNKHGSISCVYLFLIGGHEIADAVGAHVPSTTGYIYKFGCTSNITKRMYSLQNKYGKLGATCIKLIYFFYVDPTQIFDAESDLKKDTFFSQMILKIDEYKELAFIPSSNLAKVKRIYNKLGYDYRTKLDEATTLIQDAIHENVIDVSNHETEKAIALLQQAENLDKKRTDELQIQRSEYRERIEELKELLEETKGKLRKKKLDLCEVKTRLDGSLNIINQLHDTNKKLERKLSSYVNKKRRRAKRHVRHGGRCGKKCYPTSGSESSDIGSSSTMSDSSESSSEWESPRKSQKH